MRYSRFGFYVERIGLPVAGYLKFYAVVGTVFLQCRQTILFGGCKVCVLRIFGIVPQLPKPRIYAAYVPHQYFQMPAQIRVERIAVAIFGQMVLNIYKVVLRPF